MRAGRHRIGNSAWSVFLRIEELVLAASGEDAFEVAYALVAARLYAARFEPTAKRTDRASIEARLGRARRAWPWLEAQSRVGIPDVTLAAVERLLDLARLEGDAEGIDALFEQLVSRVGKAHKGQFFTPRHVVDFAVRVLSPRDGERFLDPACGSGAFVHRALAAADVRAEGCDIDARAVRIARLLAVAVGSEPEAFARSDSLAPGTCRGGTFDVIATNPPFAGRAIASGFELAQLGQPRLERDALFLEVCLGRLRPGGRLAIVLPYGKVASPGWGKLRRWWTQRARVLAVVSLPNGTFRPHTAMKTALVFAAKRAPGEPPSPGERVFLAVSERPGVDASGEPVLRKRRRASGRSWRDRDHDLGSLLAPLRAFLAKERFSPPVPRAKARRG